MNLIAAKCPSCGADIQVPDNKDYAFCTFCGANVKVRESIIMKSDVDTDNLVSLGYTELQAKDYDEAMSYFTRVLDTDGKNAKAWMGKGLAVIRKAESQSKSYEEALVYFKNALVNTPETGTDSLKQQVLTEYEKKKFYNGHIEFLDSFVKFNPDKKYILILLNLLDSLQAETEKAGGKFSQARTEIKANALAMLKENYPEEYERYNKNIKSREQGLNNQAESNRIKAIENKRKELYSGKRILKDMFLAVLLNGIVVYFILAASDYAKENFSSGFLTFFAGFIILFIFGQIGIFINKRNEFKQFEKNLK